MICCTAYQHKNMTQQIYEVVYISLDLIGIGTFGWLFLMLRPRPWSWNKFELAFALMKLALVVFFAWLLVADLATHLDIESWQWLSQYPARGLGLRLILLLPGVFLITRLTK